MRKIYLEGQLGQKFGSSHLFCGDTPADAFRLIGTNYPEFRKYLIECHENDIGFHVEVNNEDIDITECLLPLSKGDIVVTPVPSGSKSGGAKILAAVALYFITAGIGNALTLAGTTHQATLASKFFLAAGKAITVGGQMLSVNLALTGIQQLMAPDPATDQQNEEGYLFTGDARNVVEGDPIPLLYGELRVPGIPISVEVLPHTPADSYATHLSSYNNDIDYDEESNGMIFEYNLRNDGTGYTAPYLSMLSSLSGSPGRSQNIVTTSVISEGPIYGLVRGASSVYLNNDPALDPVDSNGGSKATVSLTNGSSAGSVNGTVSDDQVTSEDENTTTRGTIENYKTGTAQISYGSDIQSDGFGGWIPVNRLQIISTTSVFTNDMLFDVTEKINTKVRIMDSVGGLLYEDVITAVTSATTVDIGAGALPRQLENGTSYAFAIDYATEIEVESDGNVTLGGNFGGGSGDYQVRVGGSEETIDDGDNYFTAAKYRNFGVQFRTGHLYQRPLKSVNGTGNGNTSITTSLNNDIGKTRAGVGTDSYTYNTTTLGLSRTQALEADEVGFLISYQSLINYTAEGKEKPGKAWYKIEVRFTNDGSNFTDWKVVEDKKRHMGQYNSTFTFYESVNLEQHRPSGAIDWEIKITRLSRTDVPYENTYLVEGPSDYTSETSATIVTAITTIKELLTYPLTSVARVQFNSQDFNGVPSIGFHCKGMKVLVPSNYVTREEASDGVASYKRDPATDEIGASYVNWDGNFRSKKVYTNNPAWIFYDILVNNRYGLGSFLTHVFR